MTLKSAKGVIFRLSRFHDQITENNRDLAKIMQRYTARNSFSGVLGYIFSKSFRHLAAKGPKFWSAKGKGLKAPDAHPYPRLYRSAPPPPPRKTTKTECRNCCCSQKDLSVVYEHYSHEFLILSHVNSKKVNLSLLIASMNKFLSLGLTKTDYEMSFNRAGHFTQRSV